MTWIIAKKSSSEHKLYNLRISVLEEEEQAWKEVKVLSADTDFKQGNSVIIKEQQDKKITKCDLRYS